MAKKERSIIGERIKLLRDKNQLTQDQLAGILGIKNQTISNYESGEREPSYEVLIKIADHFKVTTDYLLGRSSFISVEEEMNIRKYDSNNKNIEKLDNQTLESIKAIEENLRFIIDVCLCEFKQNKKNYLDQDLDWKVYSYLLLNKGQFYIDTMKCITSEIAGILVSLLKSDQELQNMDDNTYEFYLEEFNRNKTNINFCVERLIKYAFEYEFIFNDLYKSKEGD